ncbi:dipeptidase [Microvirga antarctica]|uniref:dipeptidase n=1 Tax=Microvirga antarctica TaxID=2819233 RepID=UPI001B3163FB|nr:membrane dipeptidase [Microvirga antarctica]
MPETLDAVGRHPLEKGWHRDLKHPFVFIDGCVQIWPDADFSRLKDCGVTAYVITAFRPHDGAENAFDAIAEWWRVARTYPNDIRIALTAADITDAKAAGQASIVIGSQGGDFLGQNLNRLEMFHRLGLRVAIPAYNSRSTLADGLMEPANAGLSRMGERFVEACNRLGVLIDLTHVGERSSLEILAQTKHPVVFSHSNPRALVDSRRNITDEQIRLCAQTGGVIGVTNWGPLNFKPDATDRPRLDDYLDAVSYVVDLVGIDHVGVGTDMSHGTYPDGDLIRNRNAGTANRYAQFVEDSPRSRRRYVEGFDDYGQLIEVTEAMSRRGFSGQDIEKILGGNLLRVYAQVWGS